MTDPKKQQAKGRLSASMADGIVVTCLGVLFLIYSLVQFREISRKVSWIMSPYLFPILISVFAVILGAGILREALQEKKAEMERSGHEETVEETMEVGIKRTDNRETLHKTLRVLVVIGLAAAYDLGLGWIGFLPATAIYLALMTLYLGERRWYVVGLIAVLAPLALYAVFKLGLNVRLP